MSFSLLLDSTVSITSSTMTMSTLISFGQDSDTRRRNNFNGEEDFFISCNSLNDDGTPESQFIGAQINGGRLEGEEGIQFLVSFSNTEVLLREPRSPQI